MIVDSDRAGPQIDPLKADQFFVRSRVETDALGAFLSHQGVHWSALQLCRFGKKDTYWLFID